MKNRLKALVASMTKQKDGYDPDDKTEHGGREHASREAIRGAVFADPFGDPTRRARRALLVVAVLTLIINARLPIDKIPYLDSLPSEQSALVILGLLSVGLVYLLIIFVVSAGVDLARWRLTADNLVLKHITDHVGGILEFCRRISLNMPILDERPQKETIKQSVKDIADKVPDIQTRIDRTIAYYDSTSRLQWFRMIALDLALPLTVAIIALWKVYALVLPMISKIWSA